MKLQPRESSDVTEVPVEGKESRAMLESKNCDEGVDGGQSHTPRARKPDQAGGIPVRLNAPRFKQIPKAQVAFNAVDVLAKSLKHLRNNGAA